MRLCGVSGRLVLGLNVRLCRVLGCFILGLNVTFVDYFGRLEVGDTILV